MDARVYRRSNVDITSLVTAFLNFRDAFVAYAPAPSTVSKDRLIDTLNKIREAADEIERSVSNEAEDIVSKD